MSNLAWQSIAESYASFGFPFDPTDEDAAIQESFIRTWTLNRSSHELELIILGVTPRLINLRWPENDTITAFEASPPVIHAL